MRNAAARAATLIALGSALGLAVNAARSDGLRFDAYAPITTCASAPTVVALPPTEAVRLCGDPGVLLADVRPAERFAAGHVAGAVHLPCGASGDLARAALERAADKNTVIVYGDTTAEAAPVAETLRRRLPQSGIKVITLEGGFPAWDRAGLACSSGPCPECKEHAERRP